MANDYLIDDLVPRRGQKYSTMSRSRMAEFADTLMWFHAIDCGDFQTSGRFPPGTPQNATLYPAFDLLQAMDLGGATCLDIGTADGLLAFGMEKLGAKRVIAVDSFTNKGFLLARAALGSNVEYFSQLQVKDLPRTFRDASFDVVVCAGIIYHMFNPLSAFTIARQLVKEGGLFLVESAMTATSDKPVLFLNSEAEIIPERYTYWVPTRAAIEGMMRLACFDVVAARTMRSPQRLTLVGRACKPEEVKGRSPLLRRIHSTDFCDFEFSLSELFAESRATAAVSLRVREASAEVDPARWAGNFPFHPKTPVNVKGTTRWSTREGNR